MSTRLEAKLLYRQLDRLFGSFDPGRPPDQLLQAFLEESFHALSESLHLASGHLYGEKRDGFELLGTVGHVSRKVPDLLDPQTAPLAPIFRHKVYIFPGSPEGDRGLLEGLDSAGLVVGRRPSRHVFFFTLGGGWIREELDFALNTIRAALGSRLLDGRVRGSFLQAAEIQQSLLLDEPPEFSGYELACRSETADEVGGDFFDFLPFGDELLGVAIGDASGHGLPAALLVRDVVTGLRMGLEKDLKVTHVFEKLNSVIHRSNLSSRFVSVFYGELETDGTLIYVNAGHQPPLLFSGQKAIPLAKGGTVIGPLPEVRFKRGSARLLPGDLLVMCTDGILERRGRDGEFFGEEALKNAVLESRSNGAASVLEQIFRNSFDHGHGRPWEDDATAVVVRRTS